MSSSSAAPPDPRRPDDAELVDRAACGDRAALDQLLRRYEQRILAICLRMTGNPADAADAAQEAMIAICRGLPRFDKLSAFSTWLYRVTTNACLDELRRRARRPVAIDHPAAPGAVTGAHDEAVSARVTLDEALAHLPAPYRAALVLRELCELNYEEIGAVLEIPPGTVRSRIARARDALAHELGNHENRPRRPTSRP